MNSELSRQKYINLETFRKNGASVRTPVWFVMEGNVLYIRTQADSGKVKRVRRNGQVQIAPCKVDGDLLGDWNPALAREVSGHDLYQKVDHLLDQKYGLTKKIFGLFTTLRGREYSILEVKVRQ